MKGTYSHRQSRISVFWVQCLALAAVLSGLENASLAAVASSDHALELTQPSIALEISDVTWLRSPESSPAVTRSQASAHHLSTQRLNTQSLTAQSRHSVSEPSWMKTAEYSQLSQQTGQSQFEQVSETSKKAFVKRQSRGSAQQLLASRPENVLAQATEGADSPNVEPNVEPDVDQLRRDLSIDPLAELRIPAYAPGSTVGVPSAFGANFGDAFVGLAFSNRRPRINESDGALSVGFGLGDSERSLGLEVSANIGSLRRFGANGDIGLKLHRALPGKAAIALGFDEGIVWGDENRSTVSSLYGVVSKIFDLSSDTQNDPRTLTLTLGVGGGRFRSFEKIETGRGGVGVFASAGFRFVPQASAIASWTGQDLNLGISYVPLKTTPLFLTFVVGNVLNRNDNATLFSFGIGYGFNYAGYQY